MKELARKKLVVYRASRGAIKNDDASVVDKWVVRRRKRYRLKKPAYLPKFYKEIQGICQGSDRGVMVG